MEIMINNQVASKLQPKVNFNKKGYRIKKS